MSLTINNSVPGLNSGLKQINLDLLKSGGRIATGSKGLSNELVANFIGNGLKDQNNYSSGLLRAASLGINKLLTAKGGVERISAILSAQKEIIARAGMQNEGKILHLNNIFQSNLKQISQIVKALDFSGVKLLDGTYGVEKDKLLRYLLPAYIVGIAAKTTPSGAVKFLNDNLNYTIHNTSLSTLNITSLVDGDYIILDGIKFTFKSEPSGKNEIKISSDLEESCRNLITAILTSKELILKKYVLTSSGGGIVNVRSLAWAGDAIALTSSNNLRLSVDNTTGQAVETIINLNNLLDNEAFFGTLNPNFTCNLASLCYGLAARQLALQYNILLSGYVGDAGDSAAEYSCTIGDKQYKGILFIRGNGGAVSAMNAAPAGPEKGYLYMVDTENSNSHFRINFSAGNTAILNNAVNAAAIANDLNELFSRIVFRQTRVIDVNEAYAKKTKRMFDPKTTSALITATDFNKLAIDKFDIINLSNTLAQFTVNINGADYVDATVSKKLKEGDQVSMENGNSFVSISLGKKGLELSDIESQKNSAIAFYNFLTNDENFLDIYLSKNGGKTVSMKLPNLESSALLVDSSNQAVNDLNILDRAARRKAEIIFEDASQKVLTLLASINDSLNMVNSEASKVIANLNLADEVSKNYLQANLLDEAKIFSQRISEIMALMAVESSTAQVDMLVNNIVRSINEAAEEASPKKQDSKVDNR